MQAHRLEGPPGPTWHTCNLPPVSIAMHYQAAHNSAGMHVSAVYVFAWHARGSTTQHQRQASMGGGGAGTSGCVTWPWPHAATQPLQFATAFEITVSGLWADPHSSHCPCLKLRPPNRSRPIRSRRAATAAASWCWYMPPPALIRLPCCNSRPRQSALPAARIVAAQPSMAALTVCSAAACKAQTVRSSVKQPKVRAMKRPQSRPRSRRVREATAAARASGGSAGDPTLAEPKPLCSWKRAAVLVLLLGAIQVAATSRHATPPSRRLPSPRCRAWPQPWAPPRCC